jgi:polyisoprenoid-binding protein YceI
MLSGQEGETMIRATAALLLAGSLAMTAAPEAGVPAPPIWGRIELIGAEPFGVDASHSYLGFSIGFMGITKVRGTFRTYAAWILYDEKDPTKTSATVLIDPSSIDTGSEFRDKDLKSARFFDVEKHPLAIFQTQRIERTEPDRYVVHGTLEIKGVKRPVDLPMTQTLSRMPDVGWGNIRVGGSGFVTVKRTDFGILGDEFWGNKALADDVEISIDVLGTRSNHDRWSFDSKEKPSIGEAIWKTYEAGGIDQALGKYAELMTKQPNAYNFAPSQIAIVGHRLLQRRRLPEALRVYELGLAAGPSEPAGFHCKIGEVHAAQGDREAAIESYRKALELNKNSAEAIEMLRHLDPRPPAATGR